jgi:glycosyltransferase involved in cell wall biosynthesis
MKASVIFSTYNSPAWLEKVLWGFSVQTTKDFEIVIADDGSGQETKELIERLRPEMGVTVKHIWQEDDGFQKSRILNKAIVAAEADYLIFTDGDCIPRKDFVEVHLKGRKQGHFLSGGYFLLPMQTSLAIEKEDILSQKCFKVGWLKAHGLKGSIKTLKLSARGVFRYLLNRLTRTKPTWNGHNSSGWKSDILEANGFDERMQYGGQDRELGERLVNMGIGGVQIRYSAIVVHLDHKRGYRTQESVLKNRAIRKNTRDSDKKRTEFGIVRENV